MPTFALPKRPLAIGTALVVAFQLAACSVSGEAGSLAGSGDSRREHASEGGDLTVRLSIAVDRGHIDVRVIDPSGDEQYTAEFRAGDSLSRSFQFPGERGLWAVEFALEDAAGIYEVEWLE